MRKGAAFVLLASVALVFDSGGGQRLETNLHKVSLTFSPATSVCLSVCLLSVWSIRPSAY